MSGLVGHVAGAGGDAAASRRLAASDASNAPGKLDPTSEKTLPGASKANNATSVAVAVDGLDLQSLLRDTYCSAWSCSAEEQAAAAAGGDEKMKDGGARTVRPTLAAAMAEIYHSAEQEVSSSNSSNFLTIPFSDFDLLFFLTTGCKAGPAG